MCKARTSRRLRLCSRRWACVAGVGAGFRRRSHTPHIGGVDSNIKAIGLLGLISPPLVEEVKFVAAAACRGLQFRPIGERAGAGYQRLIGPACPPMTARSIFILSRTNASLVLPNLRLHRHYLHLREKRRERLIQLLGFLRHFRGKVVRPAEVFRKIEELELSGLPGLHPFEIAPAQRRLGAAAPRLSTGRFALRRSVAFRAAPARRPSASPAAARDPSSPGEGRAATPTPDRLRRKPSDQSSPRGPAFWSKPRP